MEINTYSFIVPVYNAERYIQRCIDSIVQGMTDNDELILVDDGSNDRSGNMCDDYCVNRKNVKVIHQKNGGESVARNAGINISSKKWLIFIDADDFLDASYRDILNKNIDDKSDYILFSYCQDDGRYTNNTNEEKKVIKFYTEDRKDLVSGCFRGKQKFASEGVCNSRTAWAKVFKRQFIQDNHLKFPEGVFMGGDCLFMAQVYALTQQAKFVQCVFYHYFFQNADSITNRYKPNMNENTIARENAMRKWLLSNPDYECLYRSYYLNSLILHIRDDFFHKNNTRNTKQNRQHFREVIDEGKYKDAYQIAKKSGELKYHPGIKRFVFWLAVKKQYSMLKLIYKIRY